MRITDVTLSILRTELDEAVIPTRGAVDAMPPLVLVSVATAEGIDGNYISYLIPAEAVEHAAKVAKAILVGRDTCHSWRASSACHWPSENRTSPDSPPCATI
jgi:hypothetical protein